MKRSSLFLLFATPVIAGASVLACGSSSDCNETKSCGVSPTDDGSSGSSGGEGGMTDGPQIDAPPGCDLTKEPKDAPACVDDGVGVFVDAKSGNDTGAGTKAAPFKTIGKAVASAGQKRVYVCEGDYPENVKLTSAVSIYGGFACGAWSYSGNKPSVTPASGYALEIAAGNSAVGLTDLSFTAPPGTEAAPNSIAAFVSASTSVKLTNVDLTAKDAAKGKDEVKAADGSLQTPTEGTGNDAVGNGGGGAKACTCVGGKTSVGAAGGSNGGNGSDGETAIAGADVTAGKGSTAGECGSGTNGRAGAPAPDVGPADGAKTRGALTAAGWTSQSGQSGTAGLPGQGGGGGGGAPATGGFVPGGGGSGSCGGCGGAGGLGGGGGGASVALASLDSAVSVAGGSMTAAKAGNGGKGGAGGFGQDSGAKGNGSGDGCSGGKGGKGAAGGAGGGGAGGVSAAILAKGGTPTVGGTTLKFGSAGAAGGGGVATVNDGIAGDARETIILQ